MASTGVAAKQWPEPSGRRQAEWHGTSDSWWALQRGRGIARPSVESEALRLFGAGSSLLALLVRLGLAGRP